MSWVAVAVAGAGVVGAVVGSSSQSSAANTAADAQTSASQAGIAAQKAQFDSVQKLLAPYNAAGTSAVNAQGNLIGLNGQGAQQQAIDGIQNGAQYQSMLKAGNDNILANASATGGLRGGNTQAALAQFSPQLLSQLINQQYSQLGGLTNVGANAAAGVGNSGSSTTNAITGLLGQQGSAQAGAALAGGNATGQLVNGVTSGIGTLAAQSGFGGGGYNQYSTFGGYSTNPNPGSADFAGITGGGGGDFSDVRLKTNIKRIGTSTKGHALYDWRWKASGQKGRGVIAQEVAHVPGAVAADPYTGFLTVDYSKVL